MRLFLAFLFIAAGPAFASDATDFVQNFSAQSELEHAVGAYKICEDSFALSPDAYAARIVEIGRLWQAQPEGAYHLLSTCQTMWITRFLDPVKTGQILKRVTGAEAAYKISALDLLGAARALREEIRLFNDVNPGHTHGQLPAPYEVLSGMASSARQLDETLQRQVGLAVSAVTALSTGTAVQVLLKTRAFAQATAYAGGTASLSGFEAALVVAVLAYGAGEAADYGVWWWHKRDLWNQVRAATAKLESRDSGQPLPLVLDEFYKSVERLGYFYSYNLYLVESGQAQMAEINEKCYAKLQSFFSDPGQFDWGVKFKRRTVCGDAAALWAGASQYLARLFPGDPQAMAVAERLMARAKRTVWLYAETERFRDASGYVKPWPF